MQSTQNTTPQRERFMRPVEGGFDIYHRRGTGYMSETRWGHIAKQPNGYWKAWHMVGRNPQRYAIPGAFVNAREAAIAASDYAIEQGRIANEQVAIERANGWSTD